MGVVASRYIFLRAQDRHEYTRVPDQPGADEREANPHPSPDSNASRSPANQRDAPDQRAALVEPVSVSSASSSRDYFAGHLAAGEVAAVRQAVEALPREQLERIAEAFLFDVRRQGVVSLTSPRPREMSLALPSGSRAPPTGEPEDDAVLSLVLSPSPSSPSAFSTTTTTSSTRFIPPATSFPSAEPVQRDMLDVGVGERGETGEDSGRRIPPSRHHRMTDGYFTPEEAVRLERPRPRPARGRRSRRFNWSRGQLLGLGACGRVFYAMNLDTGMPMAVKEVRLPGKSGGTRRPVDVEGQSAAAGAVASGAVHRPIRKSVSMPNIQRALAADQGKPLTPAAARALQDLEKEISLLRSLSHPNIVRYLGTERSDTSVHIFLEFVPGGSISSLLSEFGPFSVGMMRRYTRQILEGLYYLHTHQIIHRDVKGSNILVSQNGVCKLTDFGASAYLADVNSERSGLHGTVYWMAPEVVRQAGHGRQSDVWSVGCTLIEMATGRPPWSHLGCQAAALFQIGTGQTLPDLPSEEQLSESGLDFVQQCLTLDPTQRPNVVRLLQHPFVAGRVPRDVPDDNEIERRIHRLLRDKARENRGDRVDRRQVRIRYGRRAGKEVMRRASDV